jgi:hypothetical protein
LSIINKKQQMNTKKVKKRLKKHVLETIRVHEMSRNQDSLIAISNALMTEGNFLRQIIKFASLVDDSTGIVIAKKRCENILEELKCIKKAIDENHDKFQSEQ